MKRVLMLFILACLISGCAKQKMVETTFLMETGEVETVAVTETEETLPPIVLDLTEEEQEMFSMSVKAKLSFLKKVQTE